MPNDKRILLGKYAHLHLLIFIWGFTAVLGKLIRLDALSLTWYRLGLAVIPLAVVRLLQKRRWKYDARDYLRMGGAGLLIALHWLAFFGAIKWGNVSATLIALSSGAFFASVLEPLIYGRRISGREVLFGLLVIVGIGYIFGTGHIRWAAFGLALAAAFLSALFSVWNGLLIRHYRALDLSLTELAAGFAVLSAVMLLQGKNITLDLSGTDWLWLLILAWVCTSYTFTVSLDLLRHINPFTLMLSINLEPVYGMVLALLVFGDSERMGTGFYIGSALILGLVLLNSYIKWKRTA